MCPYLPAPAQTDTRREMKQIRASGGNNCPPHTSCCFDSRATRMHHFFIKVFPICHRNSTFGQASPGNNSNSPKRAWRVLAVVLFITTSSRKLHVEHLGNGLINCHTTPRSVTRHHRDRAGHFCVLLSDTQSRAWNSIKPVHQDLPGTKSTGASGCWQSYLFKTLMYLNILSIFLNRQRGGVINRKGQHSSPGGPSQGRHSRQGKGFYLHHPALDSTKH